MSIKVAWKQKFSFLLLIVILLTSVSSCKEKSVNANIDLGNLSQRKNNHLNVVKQRGYLICGISGEIPGFSFFDFNSRYAGMDADFCRAVASALFDDPDKVEFRELNVNERFNALKSGEIDLLSRNTTKTLSRDTKDNIEFTPPIFYDAQGIMVNQASGIDNLKDLEGKSICVAEGTTSYDNLNDYKLKVSLKNL